MTFIISSVVFLGGTPNTNSDNGPVIRKVNSATHWIVIFRLPQKGIKSNDTRDIELARDKK